MRELLQRSAIVLVMTAGAAAGLACMLMLGCRPAAPATTKPGAAATKPAAAGPGKEKIRVVVRSHMGEVRACYNEGLARDPTLMGRVTYDFTIGPKGDVTVVVVVSTELPDSGKGVQECIRSAIGTWTFPRPPHGGNIVVRYPFVLVPQGDTVSRTKLAAGIQREGVWFPLEDRPPRTAIVEVLDTEEQPVPGAVVMLTVDSGERRETVNAVTDTNGLAVFSDLPAARTVQASAEGVHTEAARLGRKAIGVIVHVGIPHAEP